MKKLCTYVFKKGKRKGQLCNDICIPKLSFCQKHERQVKQEIQSVTVVRHVEDSLKQKILNLETIAENKAIIMRHYTNMKKTESNSTEYYKNQIFVDLSLSYPWNKYFDINTILKDTNIKSFLYYIKTSFDKHIYGMNNVKNEIINMVCKFITNPTSNRNIIALCGAAGVGKSKFIKILSEVLDLPMKVISLGGIKDSSFFLGHGYVYVESGPGKILQNIIDSKISNPIIYFDELDKVSESENGKDIYSFLCYLTDSTQNNTFTDHYFYGMKFDLSKVFFVFTFNDVSKIDKILLDRLNVINVATPSKKEIATILEKHCIPEIISNIGLKTDIKMKTEHIEHIINTYESNFDKSGSSGIREYYRILEKIMLEINKDILLDLYDLSGNIMSDSTFHKYLSIIDKQLCNHNLSLTNFSHMHMYI
jgi:ATP-dependent Lon protease